jgi:hypothetical protein
MRMRIPAITYMNEEEEDLAAGTAVSAVTTGAGSVSVGITLTVVSSPAAVVLTGVFESAERAVIKSLAVLELFPPSLAALRETV